MVVKLQEINDEILVNPQKREEFWELMKGREEETQYGSTQSEQYQAYRRLITIEDEKLYLLLCDLQKTLNENRCQVLDEVKDGVSELINTFLR